MLRKLLAMTKREITPSGDLPTVTRANQQSAASQRNRFLNYIAGASLTGFLATIAFVTLMLDVKRDFSDLSGEILFELESLNLELARQGQQAPTDLITYIVAPRDADDDVLDITFFVPAIEKRVTFLSGEQSFLDDYRRAKMANFARQFVATIAEKSYREDIIVQVEFEGSADGVGGDDYLRTPYKGALGPEIVVSRPKIDGALSHTRKYRIGSKIKNEDLALIRAYAMFLNFNEFMERDQRSWVNSMSFAATTFVEVGENFRFGKITIRIMPKQGGQAV